MEQTNCKNPWSCQALVEHAGNWSLAGNVGLLKHMEHFANNLFQHIDETYDNLQSLMIDLDSAEIRLDLVKNQFLGLQNTQFIESRVYDEDETINSHMNEAKDQKVDESSKHLITQNAVLDGLQVLEKYYERVSIPESDSEGDEPDCPNYVLHEKDPYLNRPLPYIIGTDEWHTKWHAGLEESSEDEDDLADKNVCVEDEFSDTDSESNLPIADRRTYSKELINNNILDNSINRQLDDDINYAEVNGNSSLAVQANATFAEQLAAKLGNVLTTNIPNGNQDQEVNTRPIQRRPFSSSILSEVPPQLPSDIENAPKHGMFSGDGGLFDDDDDDSDDDVVKPPPIFPASKEMDSSKVPNLFDDDDADDDLVMPPSIDKVELPPKKSVGGLFDESDDDEDMFSISNNKGFPKLPKAGPLFMPQEPPELKKGLPIGGVKVLGGILHRRVSSSSSTSSSIDQNDKVQSGAQCAIASTPSSSKTASNPVKTLSSSAPIVNKSSSRTVISLFDDTDNLFEDDLFSDINSVMKKPRSIETLKKPISLSSANETTEQILFPSIGPDTSKNMRSLFEDSDNEETVPQSTNDAKPPSLFSNSKSGAKSVYLFDDDNANVSDHDLWLNSDLEEKEGLCYTECKSDNIEKVVEIIKPIVHDTPSIVKTDDLITDGLHQPVFKLFDDKPPLLTPDDNDYEDWDTKSRSSSSLSDKFMEPQLNVNEATGQLNFNSTTLPDIPPFEATANVKECPVSETHKNDKIPAAHPDGINIEKRKSPGKLKHNLNINVNALIPGAKFIKPQQVETEAEPINRTENSKVDEFNTTNDNETKDFDNNNKTISTRHGDEVEILQSITKSRPRIMVKRKPSTRQGRRAALEKTKTIDDDNGKHDTQLNLEEQEVIGNEPTLILVSNTIPSNDLKYKDGPATVHRSKKIESLFEDNDIFSNAAITSRTNDNTNKIENLGTPKKLLIVDDDVDESTKSQELALPVSKERPEVKKISLFDDDMPNVDEDIFASAPIFSGKIANPLLISSTNVGNVRVYNTTLDDIAKTPITVSHGISSSKPVISAASDVLFGGPKTTKHDDLFRNIRSPTGISKATTQTSFLEEDDDLSGDLFGPVKTIVVAPKAREPDNTITSELKKKSLFVDEDDDDLFGGFKVKPVVNDNKGPIRKVQSDPVKGKGKSLFDDEDEEDDLFAFNKTTPKPVVRKLESNKTASLLTKSKLSTAKVTQPVKDPLDALLGDSD